MIFEKRMKLRIKGTRTARRTQRSGARMKRIEKSKANSRQKSKANGRQDKNIANGRHDKNIANVRQSKPKDYDRNKAKCEDKHSTQETCSQRCRCPAGARRSHHGYFKGRFRRGNRGVQDNHPDSSGAAIKKVQKTAKILQIRDCEHSEGFFKLESRGSMKSAQRAKTAATS